MVHRFLDNIRHMGRGSRFDDYLVSLHRSFVSGVPTLDQAKQDYQVAMSVKVILTM